MQEKMIDRKAFIEFWQKRNNSKAAFFFLILYVAGIIGCFVPAAKKMNEHPLFAVAWFVLFFAYLLGMPFLWSRILYGKPDPQFLKCPFCKKRLGRINQLVIATGKCGHCGTQILIDCEQGASPDFDSATLHQSR